MVVPLVRGPRSLNIVLNKNHGSEALFNNPIRATMDEIATACGDRKTAWNHTRCNWFLKLWIVVHSS